jgi:hypothetical protein
MVDVTGATVTITSNGGGFDVQFRASVGCSGIATAGFQLVIDGVTEVLLGSIVFAAGEVKPVELCHHVPAKSIASHTFKIQAYTNAGTLTVYGSSSGYGSPQLYVVERGG